jgi:MoxR-like ATPase
VLNERLYNNGRQTVDCNLEVCFGASHELPESKNLNALYDRFLVRRSVTGIKDRDNGMKLLQHGSTDSLGADCKLTLDEIHMMQQDVDGCIDIPEAMFEAILNVWEELDKDGRFDASDRRMQASLKIVKASAYLNGRDEVNEDDLMVLQHVLWQEVKDVAELADIVAKTANPMAARIQEILDSAKSAYQSIEIGREVAPEKRAAVFTDVARVNGDLEEMSVELGNLLKNDATEQQHEKIAAAQQQIEEWQSDLGQWAVSAGRFKV